MERGFIIFSFPNMLSIFANRVADAGVQEEVKDGSNPVSE
jgi:hypothetical protein